MDQRDISNRDDIKTFVDQFYKKALEDELIGFIFKKAAKINLEKHMPVMYDFWDSTLFNSSVYSGNPMRVHLALDDKVTLTKEHFDRWLRLFNTTIDEHFKGEKAELAKTRALSIATVMQIKLFRKKESRDDN